MGSIFTPNATVQGDLGLIPPIVESQTESYINCIIGRKQRSAVAKFRCGTSPIRIKTGRYERLLYHDRLMPFCKKNMLKINAMSLHNVHYTSIISFFCANDMIYARKNCAKLHISDLYKTSSPIS